MKKEVKEFKSLYDYLEERSKEEINELYQKLFGKLDNKKNNEQKIDDIYSHVIANYMYSLYFKNNFDIEVIEDIIKGKQPKNVNQELIDNFFVIKTDDGYTTFEEVKNVCKESKNEQILAEKRTVALKYYTDINGVIEIDTLIELMKKTGLDVNKEEIEEISNKKEWVIKENYIYANPIAENLNFNNKLMDTKKDHEYKVSSFEEITSEIIRLELMNPYERIVDLLSKKTKVDVRDIAYFIVTRVRAGDDYKNDIEEILDNRNIKLGNLKKRFYDLLEKYYYSIPLWSLNGHFLSELDENDINDYKLDINYLEKLIDYGDEKFIKDDLISVSIYAYLAINGVIKVDDLLSIVNDNYWEKVTKKDLIKFIKKDDALNIVDDYVIVKHIPKDMVDVIIASKKSDNFYIIEDFDEFDWDYEKNHEELMNVLIKYNISKHLQTDIELFANIGMFNEEVIIEFLERNAICLSEKLFSKLYNDLKKCINNMRLWYLNGFKVNEVSSISNKKKIGRNDPCPCGSGKKYKKCCGK